MYSYYLKKLDTDDDDGDQWWILAKMNLNKC